MLKALRGQRSLVKLFREYENMLCICTRSHSTESESVNSNDKNQKPQNICRTKNVKGNEQSSNKEEENVDYNDDSNKTADKCEYAQEQQESYTHVRDGNKDKNNNYDQSVDYHEEEEEEEEEEKRYVPQWFNKQVTLDEDEFTTKQITLNDILPRGRWSKHGTTNKQQDIKQPSSNKIRSLYDVLRCERRDVYEKYARAQQEEMHAKDAAMGKSNKELFPNWAPDEEAPRAEFMQLDQSLQIQYIYNRLSMAERRIRLAPDYGAHGLSVHLYYGDLMLKECEELLKELGWMTEPVQSRINQLKALSLNHKIENDLL